MRYWISCCSRQTTFRRKDDCLGGSRPRISPSILESRIWDRGTALLLSWRRQPKHRRRIHFAEAQMVLNWVENTSPGTTDATDAGEQLPTTFPNGRRLLSVQQWADEATAFSSQYENDAPCNGAPSYSARQATGAPNYGCCGDTPDDCSNWDGTNYVRPACGDYESSWNPEVSGSRRRNPRDSDPQWLQLSFPTAAYATSIQIYETHHGTNLLTYYIHLHSFPWFILSLGLYCYGLDPLV